MRAVFGHVGEKQLLKKHFGTYNYTMHPDGNSIFVSKSYNCFFFLQILVCALITANLWLKVQAQLLPVPLFNVPALPLNQQTIVNPAGGGAVAGVVPVINGVPVGATGVNGITQNIVVSIN